MRSALGLVLCVVIGFAPLTAQPHAQFTLSLDLHYDAAEKAIELYEGLSGRPAEVAALRGSQLALAVTGMLSRTSLQTADLERSLAAAKFNQSDGADLFRMREARMNVAAIRAPQSPPAEFRSTRRRYGGTTLSGARECSHPPYVVAFGHQNIDAFVVRVTWKAIRPIRRGNRREFR
jgi:hypothetical protein